MKTYRGVDVWTHVFLISALVGSEWPPSRPGRFTRWERGPCTHWTEGWVDPRAGLGDMEKWKFLTPLELELRNIFKKYIFRTKLIIGIPSWCLLKLHKAGSWYKIIVPNVFTLQNFNLKYCWMWGIHIELGRLCSVICFLSYGLPSIIIC
jgi:hypothetical protein